MTDTPPRPPHWLNGNTLDLASTPDLLAALERRFDTLILAGRVLLAEQPGVRQFQDVVRVKGDPLVQCGLARLLAKHTDPEKLGADPDMPIGGRE